MRNIDSNFNDKVNLYVNETRCKTCVCTCVSVCEEGTGSSVVCLHCAAEISIELSGVAVMTLHPRTRNRIAAPE